MALQSFHAVPRLTNTLHVWDREFRNARALLFACFLGTTALGIASDGVYHDDDLTHFLMAHWARWYPGYLLHIWGRPGFTVPVAVFAWLSNASTAWQLARLLSASVTAISTLIAVQVARELGVRRLWTVVIISYLQPLNSLLAATTLTENFAALYLVGAVRLLQLSHPLLASVVFSLTLVTRHEMAALLPIWVIAVWYSSGTNRQKALSTAMVMWAPLVHEVLYFLVFEDWPARIFLAPHGSTEYLAAGWLTYMPQALYAMTPAIAGAAVFGGLRLWRLRGIGRLVVALAVTFLATHVCITALGVFASGGYGRFMVSVAPLVAVMAAMGIEELNQRWRGFLCASIVVWLIGLIALETEFHAGRITPPESRLLWGLRAIVAMVALLCLSAIFAKGRAGLAMRWIVLVILIITTAIQVGVVVRPLHLRASQMLIRSVAEWIDKNEPDSPVFSTHPWLSYYLGFAENPRAHKGAQLLASMPVGTVFVWDSAYSPSDFHHLKIEEFHGNDAYRELAEYRSFEKSREFHVVIFKKISATPIPRATSTYPPALGQRRGPVLGSYYTRIGKLPNG